MLRVSWDFAQETGRLRRSHNIDSGEVAEVEPEVEGGGGVHDRERGGHALRRVARGKLRLRRSGGAAGVLSARAKCSGVSDVVAGLVGIGNGPEQHAPDAIGRAFLPSSEGVGEGSGCSDPVQQCRRA